MSSLILPPSCTEGIITPGSDSIWTPRKDLLFRIKKYTDLIMPPIFGGHIGLKGFYRLEAVGADGRRRWLTDWFSNKITNFGLDAMINNNVWNFCQVGTGTNPPNAGGTDTTLQTFKAGSAAKVYNAGVLAVAPLYYSALTYSYTFVTGATAGNISEIGIGSSAASGSSLFSRELIRDAGGSPAVLTLTASDTLIAYYTIRLYPPLTDVVTTLNGTIGGSPVSKTITTRAMGVVASWGIGAWFSRETNFGNTIRVGSGNTSSTGVATTGLQAFNAAAAFNNTASSVSNGSYTSGSRTLTQTATWGTGVANVAILRFQFTCAYTGDYGNCSMQSVMDSSFTKTNVQTLTTQFQISWGEYTG